MSALHALGRMFLYDHSTTPWATTEDGIPRNFDLLPFATIIFYEVEYSTYTLRQASRRSWRIGQTKTVKVLF